MKNRQAKRYAIFLRGQLQHKQPCDREERMNPKHCRAYWLITVVMCLLSTALNAAPAEKPPFYQGKSLNIVINFGAGGPTDIESRIFARHLSRHIPGAP